MQRAECRGHDNPWNRLTEESCMATWMALGGCCFKKLQVWVLRFHDINVWCIAYLWFFLWYRNLHTCIICVKLVSTCKLANVISDETESYFLQLLRIPYLVTSKLQLSCGFYSDGELNQNSFPIPQNFETQPTRCKWDLVALEMMKGLK